MIDGDTIDIEYNGGNTDRVRFLGVDTPEVNAENNPEYFEGVPDTDEARECLRDWGENSSRYVEERLEGKNVTIERPEGEQRGDYGRLLAYIYINGSERSLNYELVKEGYAGHYPAEFEREDEFLAAESDARNNSRGLWSCTA